MMKQRNKKNFLVPIAVSIIAIVAMWFAANIEVSIRQGVDGRYRYIKMPLYVKWTQFLARHYEYARLSREITLGLKTDEQKILAILDWTHKNIKDIPAGMPLVDDHIENIIIRGYGAPEQFQDVFATISYYAGMPAFWAEVSDEKNGGKYAISFVNIGGRYRVFDAYRGVYFITKNGEMASVMDFAAMDGITAVEGAERKAATGVNYAAYYRNIGSAEKPMVSHAEKQMPIPRIIFEFKKALGMRCGEAAG